MARITYTHYTDDGTKLFGMFDSEQADEFEALGPLVEGRTHTECLYRTEAAGWILNRVVPDEGGADHSLYETVSDGFARQWLADNELHDEATEHTLITLTDVDGDHLTATRLADGSIRIMLHDKTGHYWQSHVVLTAADASRLAAALPNSTTTT